MSQSRTQLLKQAGVSIWLDDLSRELIDSGSLQRSIIEHDVVGVTTNPTIFAGAIAKGAAYAEALRNYGEQALDAETAAFNLMIDDVTRACDVFSEVYASTGGRDGRVSLEVSPALAHDTDATVAQAQELWQRINRPNAMIKIPATTAGVDAIAQTIGLGISVNATLIFSLPRYREVANAYLTGLEIARGAGHDISKIHSVASVFVSRFDGMIDPLLNEHEAAEALEVRSRAGLANARLTHEAFTEIFSSVRAQMLVDLGANPQRPLWASTGTKDPTLSDTLYVTELAIAETVNTVPAATLAAFADHGTVNQTPIESLYRDSDQVLNTLDGLGVAYAEIVERLETEGLEKFSDSWNELLQTVRAGLAAKSS